MGRYDDDDSEYVVYGNMSSGIGSSEDELSRLNKFIDLFIEKYAKNNVSIEGKTTNEIIELAELLNKIGEGNELSPDDKKLMVEYGAPDALLKEDVTYNDIKNLPEFKGLDEVIGTTAWRSWTSNKTREDFKEDDIASFSAHKRIVSEFYKDMGELAKQDNDRSLYLRLVMMTKYHKFEKGCRYENPQHRLYFMKTYLATHENGSVSDFIKSYENDKNHRYHRDLRELVEGISPADAKDVLQHGVLNVLQRDRQLYPYLIEIIKDNEANGSLKENLIGIISYWIETNHYGQGGGNPGRWVRTSSSDTRSRTLMGWLDEPYSEDEKRFYDIVDSTLLQRADRAFQNHDLELLSQISAGIVDRMDEMNPQTKELTGNQIAFYEKYIPELIKNKEFHVPEEYLECASNNNLKLALDNIKYNGVRYKYEDYFEKHQISEYDASDFATLIRGRNIVDSKGSRYVSYMDKLPDAIKEGFWINTTERKLEIYKNVCEEIYEAHKAPLDDEKKTRIREVGLEVLKKLNIEHPLQEVDAEKLDNKTLLVLTYTGYVKDKNITVINSDNKIDEILLQTGLLKLSANSQVSSSPVSQYCDINEIWVDKELYGCKTNLLDRKLQRGAIKDVIDLINRGVNVSTKVERANRDNQKFPISPFDRYISGILYRGKSNAIQKLGDDMQKIAREIYPDKLFVMNKIFNSLSFKTHNDPRVKEIEKQVGQIIIGRHPKVFGKDGKDY